MARPAELAKNSRFIVLAAVCVVVAALYFAQDVLIPLALAVLFCFLLSPLVKRVERFGMHRVAAVTVVVLAATSVVGALGWATAVQVVNLTDRLDNYRDEIKDKAGNLTRYFAGRGGIVDKMKDVAEDVEKETTQSSTQPTTDKITASLQPQAPVGSSASNAGAAMAANFGNVNAPPIGSTKGNPAWVVALTEPSSPIVTVLGKLGGLLPPLGTAGLVLVFVIFMLIQREDLRNRLIRLIGHGQLNLTTTALDDAGKRMSRYMFAQAIVNGSYGIAVSIGLWAIGQFVGDKPFPSFVLWGLLCAILRFIPYIGPWIAAAFPIVLSAAVYHGFTPFFFTVGMFVVIELLSNNLMEPWLYGSSTGMSTVAVLVSAVFWTWLWGPVGLLLATPMTVCLVVLGKYVPQLQFLDILLGDEQVLEPPERLYQRLLALDQEEATELARAHLNETSLERVYDEVLLPAMAMAEQDRHRGTIDEVRETFIAQAMRGMIDELGDAARAIAEKQVSTDLREAAATNVAVAKGEAPATPDGNGKAPDGPSALAPAPAAEPDASVSRTKLPSACSVTVVCLPARDDGDDIANQMLTQLLALRGYCAVPVPVASLASEMMDAVEKHGADVVVVSALPPGAVSYSRYLCKRVHARYPNIPMAVGLWTIKGDLKKAKERITCAASVPIETSLIGMLDTIRQLAQPTIMKAGEDAAQETLHPQSN